MPCDTLSIARQDHPRTTVQTPDLPELEPRQLESLVKDGELVLDGALVEREEAQPVSAERIRITESELRGVVIDAPHAPGLRFGDVILHGCDLSNVDAREGSMRRVEIHGSRLMGFGLAGGALQDVRVVDCSLALASLASSNLKDVIFERVDLTEASFIGARLETVTFVDCKLDGTDFRGVRLKGCTIRGTALDGIIGIDSLRGVTMPWADLIDSAGALADALGIKIEPT